MFTNLVISDKEPRQHCCVENISCDLPAFHVGKQGAHNILVNLIINYFSESETLHPCVEYVAESIPWKHPSYPFFAHVVHSFQLRIIQPLLFRKKTSFVNAASSELFTRRCQRETTLNGGHSFSKVWGVKTRADSEQSETERWLEDFSDLATAEHSAELYDTWVAIRCEGRMCHCVFLCWHFFHFSPFVSLLISRKVKIWLLLHGLQLTTQHNTTQHNTTQHNTTQHVCYLVRSQAFYPFWFVSKQKKNKKKPTYSSARRHQSAAGWPQQTANCRMTDRNKQTSGGRWEIDREKTPRNVRKSVRVRKMKVRKTPRPERGLWDRKGKRKQRMSLRSHRTGSAWSTTCLCVCVCVSLVYVDVKLGSVCVLCCGICSHVMKHVRHASEMFIPLMSPYFCSFSGSYFNFMCRFFSPTIFVRLYSCDNLREVLATY